MLKYLLFVTAFAGVSTVSNAQINAALFRYPDVSANRIVFSYANDLWVVSKEGGRAAHLSSPAGVEAWPKFSPDGNTIAYTADYDGSPSIYTIPAEGGIPSRLTWQGSPERVVDWYPDGSHILFRLRPAKRPRTLFPVLLHSLCRRRPRHSSPALCGIWNPFPRWKKPRLYL